MFFDKNKYSSRAKKNIQKLLAAGFSAY